MHGTATTPEKAAGADPTARLAALKETLAKYDPATMSEQDAYDLADGLAAAGYGSHEALAPTLPIRTRALLERHPEWGYQPFSIAGWDDVVRYHEMILSRLETVGDREGAAEAHKTLGLARALRDIAAEG
jgi:hypothetical protein